LQPLLVDHEFLIEVGLLPKSDSPFDSDFWFLCRRSFWPWISESLDVLWFLRIVITQWIRPSVYPSYLPSFHELRLQPDQDLNLLAMILNWVKWFSFSVTEAFRVSNWILNYVKVA
jgi:hypothetical protein